MCACVRLCSVEVAAAVGFNKGVVGLVVVTVSAAKHTPVRAHDDGFVVHVKVFGRQGKNEHGHQVCVGFMMGE